VSLFFLSFFTLYGLLHLYVFLKARGALGLHVGASSIIIAFMLLMIAAPVIVRFSEKAGLELLARVMAFAGYTWMGLLFLMVCCSIVVDLYRLLLYLAQLVPGIDLSRISFLPGHYLLFIVALSLAIAMYGYFEARQIRIERIVIRSPKIPVHVSPVRIAQISDAHIGLIVRHDRLRRMADRVKEVEPHLFLSTGDLVDGQINNLEGLADILKEVNPHYGKYAITGNHEFYAGLDQAIEFTEKAGFTMLRGKVVTIGDFMTIVGVDDPAGSGLRKSDGDIERELLSKVPADKFTLFLKHRPDVEQDSAGLFDLQLSGHVHKGQVFPFRLFTRLFYPMYAGFYQLSTGSHLYVSRGTGTWGPPIRFLAPPEVTLIELVHEE
jgi:uncharacterized protein